MCKYTCASKPARHTYLEKPLVYCLDCVFFCLVHLQSHDAFLLLFRKCCCLQFWKCYHRSGCSVFHLYNERPILGDHHKPHFVANLWIAWNLPDFMKSSRFHALKPLNQIIQEKSFTFMECSGEAMPYKICEIQHIS